MSVYLAADAAEVREIFAKKLVAAVDLLIEESNNGDVRSTAKSENKAGLPWSVEVDYFSPTLPAATYWIWTFGFDRMHEVMRYCIVCVIQPYIYSKYTLRYNIVGRLHRCFSRITGDSLWGQLRTGCSWHKASACS